MIAYAILDEEERVRDLTEMAQAVRIGMADEKGYAKAMRALRRK